MASLRLRFALLPLVALALATAGCLGTFSMTAAEAPPLVIRPGCSLWTGTVEGNDPNVDVQAELCPVAPGEAAVVGRIQLMSPNSGWSVREVEGGVSPDGVLVLREFQFDVSAPELGWTFCLVDRYELTPSGEDQLKGHYDSEACSDHAQVELTRVK